MVSQSVIELSLTKIDYSDVMIREIDGQTINDLKESIKEHGVLQPIIVFLDKQTSRYKVICGNHRLCAAKGLGLKTIPVIIRDVQRASDGLILALNENIQRFEMNPIREGELYAKLLNDSYYSIEVLTKKIGKSRSYIDGRIGIWKNLHDDLKKEIGSVLTLTNALALAKLPKQDQLTIFKQIAEYKIPHPDQNQLGGYGGGIYPPSPYCQCQKCGAKHLKGVSIQE